MLLTKLSSALDYYYMQHFSHIASVAEEEMVGKECRLCFGSRYMKPREMVVRPVSGTSDRQSGVWVGLWVHSNLPNLGTRVDNFIEFLVAKGPVSSR